MRCFLLFALVACRGSTSDALDAPPIAIDSSVRPDGVQVDDGAPTRMPCTNQLGNAMTTAFGRLDGFLVAIVPPGNGGCNADSSHVHLQIRAKGAIYDIAVNVGSPGMQDLHTTTRELTVPGGAWSEGWHPGTLSDYVALGVHSPDLALTTEAALTSELMTDLANANHITVLATGYAPTGGHLVHRNGSGHDGLVVTQPLSNPSHARLFSFSSQAF